MSGFMKGMRLGAGLVTLGWGVSRLTAGRRDWMTTATMTTGASMVLSGMTGNRQKRRGGQMNQMLHTATDVAETVMSALR